MLDMNLIAQRDEEARAILTGNDRGGYTVPTHGLYPYQWNWDSMLAAWGFATFDVDRAWTEIETLFAHQWETGMVPHIVFHQEDEGYFPGPQVWGTGRTPGTSGITQPPIAATFVRKIYEMDPEAGRDRALALLPKLDAWHQWFLRRRSDRGRIFITHPWESGRDNAPDWDEAVKAIDTSGVGEYTRRDTAHVNPEMRPRKLDYDRYMALVYHGRDVGWDDAQIYGGSPFKVADPGMTFTLLRSVRDHAALSEALDAPAPHAAKLIAELEGGAGRLWNADAGAFDSYDLIGRRFAGSVSNASYLCWLAGRDNVSMERKLGRDFEAIQFPVASFSHRSDKFDGKRYWRGPVWPFMNTLIGIGLEDMGKADLAERLRAGTAALIAENGFNEYFDPRDGAPAGGKDFSWTAAIWLAWASPSAREV